MQKIQNKLEIKLCLLFLQYQEEHQIQCLVHHFYIVNLKLVVWMNGQIIHHQIFLGKIKQVLINLEKEQLEVQYLNLFYKCHKIRNGYRKLVNVVKDVLDKKINKLLFKQYKLQLLHTNWEVKLKLQLLINLQIIKMIVVLIKLDKWLQKLMEVKRRILIQKVAEKC